MKIIMMSRKDEILRRKQVYEEARKQHKQEEEAWSNSVDSTLESLSQLVRDKIGTTSLRLNIYADMKYSVMSIQVNNGDNPNDDQALNWRWSVTLDKAGNIIKDSGSWSGLSAITQHQIDNLKESVRILEILNNIDWSDVLNVELPRYEEYVKTAVPDREDFEGEMMQEDIIDAMEQDKLLKGHGYKFYTPRSTVFYKILRETPKQYEVQEISELNISDPSRWPESYRIPKSKFLELIDKPVQTI